MIVHSFKQPDSYCIIVAVESTSVKTGAAGLLSSRYNCVTSLPLSCEGGYPDSAACRHHKKASMNNLESMRQPKFRPQF